MISEPIGGFLSERSEIGMINILGERDPQGLSRLTYLQVLRRKNDKELLTFRTDLIKPEQRKDLSLPSGPPFVCGYGAGRFGAGSDTGRSYRIADSAVTLFRYQETLIDPELTLRRLESSFGTEAYLRTLRGLKRSLGLSEEDTIGFRPAGGIVISGSTIGSRVPLEGLADGYRLTFSWILDLYAWAIRAGSIDKEGYIEGILLIDEIDQHLHPSMQTEILPRLSELLPKMQIFATTHSPLVALDSKPEELIVLRRDGDHVVAVQNVPDFSGYSAEDMLSDPRLFDTEVYGSETREKLAEYRDLASVPKDERSLEKRRKLRSLATEINSFESPKEHESETSRLLKALMTKYDL